MEEWQEEAIAEANDLADLLKEDPTFTQADLCDRLKVWLETLRLDPSKTPFIEDSDP